MIPSALQDLETISEGHRLSPRLLSMGSEKVGQLGRSLLSARHHHALVDGRRMLMGSCAMLTFPVVA